MSILHIKQRSKVQHCKKYWGHGIKFVTRRSSASKWVNNTIKKSCVIRADAILQLSMNTKILFERIILIWFVETSASKESGKLASKNFLWSKYLCNAANTPPSKLNNSSEKVRKREEVAKGITKLGVLTLTWISSEISLREGASAIKKKWSKRKRKT